jgi:hypothetical protein
VPGAPYQQNADAIDIEKLERWLLPWSQLTMFGESDASTAEVEGG